MKDLTRLLIDGQIVARDANADLFVPTPPANAEDTKKS
jgi:hypothetical protein